MTTARRGVQREQGTARGWEPKSLHPIPIPSLLHPHPSPIPIPSPSPSLPHPNSIPIPSLSRSQSLPHPIPIPSPSHPHPRQVSHPRSEPSARSCAGTQERAPQRVSGPRPPHATVNHSRCQRCCVPHRRDSPTAGAEPRRWPPAANPTSSSPAPQHLSKILPTSSPLPVLALDPPPSNPGWIQLPKMPPQRSSRRAR